jgi:ribose/xylose/arabinose/galactoside ABC-type transport system permease subunit
MSLCIAKIAFGFLFIQLVVFGGSFFILFDSIDLVVGSIIWSCGFVAVVFE